MHNAQCDENYILVMYRAIVSYLLHIASYISVESEIPLHDVTTCLLVLACSLYNAEYQNHQRMCLYRHIVKTFANLDHLEVKLYQEFL